MWHSRSGEWLGQSVLAPSAGAYIGYLRKHGYSSRTIQAYLHDVGHFARWLTKSPLPLHRVDEGLVRRFLAEHLPNCECPLPCVRRPIDVHAALRHLLRVLRAEGRITEPSPAIPEAIQSELICYDAYLDEVCGLSQLTRVSRRMWVRKFLVARFGKRPVDVGKLTPGDIVKLINRLAEGCKSGTAHVIGTAIRSYLRCRALRGDRTESLIAAVPTVAQWPLATLPKYLSSDEVSRFLKAFNQRTASGQRGYAMARCLVDLGLRTSEVARIRLDDLDWRAGTLRISGAKSRRADLLPLPVTTARAIVRYVRVYRPRTAVRALFVRHRAPYDVPVSAAVVRCAIRLAFERCGLAERHIGPHVLRHTAATRMLQSGASLKDIADILRHRSLDTTTIYTKVDLPRLAALAVPWPGSVL